MGASSLYSVVRHGGVGQCPEVSCEGWRQGRAAGVRGDRSPWHLLALEKWLWASGVVPQGTPCQLGRGCFPDDPVGTMALRDTEPSH
jgi:hypothetical protein